MKKILEITVEAASAIAVAEYSYLALKTIFHF